jgi:hypothetical protein
MARFPTLVALALALVITTVVSTHAAPTVIEIAGNLGEPLTLNGAKMIVSQKLAADGQRTVCPGRAEFDGNGNVLVEIVSAAEGIPLRHVLVHANDGRITDANVGRKGSRG